MSLDALYYEVKQLLKEAPAMHPLEVQQTLVGDFPLIENRGSLVWKAMMQFYKKHPELVDESVINTILEFVLYLYQDKYDSVTERAALSLVMHVLGNTVDASYVEEAIQDVLPALLDARMENTDSTAQKYDELADAGFMPRVPLADVPLIPAVRVSVAAALRTRARRQSRSPRRRRASSSRSRSGSRSRSRSASRTRR